MSKTLWMLPKGAPEGATGALLNLDFGAPFAPQVESYLQGVPDPQGFSRVGIVGQAVAACLVLPALEMLGGLPELALIPFGGTGEAVGWLPAAGFRHNRVRPRRAELPHGDVREGVTVVDGGGRGLTPRQHEQLVELFGEVRVAPANPGQVDIANLAGAAGDHVLEVTIAALRAAGVTWEEITRGRVIFLPGGAGIVATVQAICLYGLGEAWHRTIRLNKVASGEFEVAEVVDPQAMRQWGATLARGLEAATPRVTLSGNIPDAFRTALAALAAEHGVELKE